MSVNITFGDNLTYLRHLRGISVQDMADMFCVHKATFRYWERGRSSPGYETLVKLSEYFQVSVDNLLKVRIRDNAKAAIQLGYQPLDS
ncbi:helix-turn-helix domain-containing protein [Chitinophaga pinensis]|uniref:Transcriptional regulator, XRE family n=1 Tax=Chitinophaga pinensis (strain ATCC 43595 / DSM 2588 / LMG 13176 / NBRC 15968 / NCIMB 11800 / UQM 2034) TaxID=485918 RepID=A0A979GVT7_CHIPD|nr:helix-turn-helix transcriptional regulator [Chitinophaga pinensis]ACU61311.1 transcriptional regulator, XRE family [Chitinophaga pinensis DSM 2588]